MTAEKTEKKIDERKIRRDVRKVKKETQEQLSDYHFDQLVKERKKRYYDEEKMQYKIKSEILQQQCGDPIPPYDFYRNIFPEGSFEKKGDQDECKPNNIILDINQKGYRRNFIVTDDLHTLTRDHSNHFVITAPISYIGKRRTGANARQIFGYTFDLDDVHTPELNNLLYQLSNDVLPAPNYIVNSGTGLHLYYIFEEPIPAYPENKMWLSEIKHMLTELLWNRYTSFSSSVQFQGLVQGYRLVGSKSKLGVRYPVTAYPYEPDNKVTIDYLVSYIQIPEHIQRVEKLRKNTNIRPTKMTLEEAIKKYPKWAEHLGEEKKSDIYYPNYRQKYVCNRALYDWWFCKIKKEASVGHRYFCLMALAIFAIKCDVDYEELYNDALSLVPTFDSLSSTHPFTEDDVVAALDTYQDCYTTFPRATIEKLTAIEIPPNKRNGRSQKEHMQIISAVRDVLYPDGEWRKNNGRPKGSGTAQNIVVQWQSENPEGRKADCVRDTGLSKKTVYKWWVAPETLTE